MYRPGHTGAALLLYAPVGHALLRSGRPVLATCGGAIAVALAMVPDYDTRIPRCKHRGATHTLVFALLVGAVLAAGGWALGTRFGGALLALGVPIDTVRVPLPGDLAALGFVVGVLTVVSHLLADLLTPMGIAPFWPVSSRRYSLEIATAANPIANAVLLAAGLGATGAVLWLARPVGAWPLG